MKLIKGKNALNKLIITVTILVIIIGMLPNTIYAATDTDGGGSIFDPCIKFITFLCDRVMQFFQDTFTSNENIEISDGVYEFKYSPAIIFSGKVQGLDINFITPNPEVKETKNHVNFLKEEEEEYKNDAGLESYEVGVEISNAYDEKVNENDYSGLDTYQQKRERNRIATEIIEEKNNEEIAEYEEKIEELANDSKYKSIINENARGEKRSIFYYEEDNILYVEYASICEYRSFPILQ